MSFKFYVLKIRILSQSVPLLCFTSRIFPFLLMAKSRAGNKIVCVRSGWQIWIWHATRARSWPPAVKTMASCKLIFRSRTSSFDKVPGTLSLKVICCKNGSTQLHDWWLFQNSSPMKLRKFAWFAARKECIKWRQWLRESFGWHSCYRAVLKDSLTEAYVDPLCM